MKDRQGEITVRDELLKVLPIWIARGGPITDTHSNRVVGQGINFGSTDITDKDGKSYPAITITGEIFKDYELDDEIWKSIKSGKYKGLSFGGATKSARTPIMQKDGSMAYSLKDLEQYEVAVCEEPAVPLALITQHNEVAKAMAGNVQDRGDGTMCIRCDKFKCYVEKGDDSFADVRGPNTPNKDDEAEALENNRGEPQENGATYHGTDKTYRDPNPEETDPKKIEANALTASKQIQVKDDKAMDADNDDALEEADLEEVEKILPLIAAAASGAAKIGARAAGGLGRGAKETAGSMLGACDLGGCEGSGGGLEKKHDNIYEVEKKRTTEGDDIEYGQINEAGKKVNRFGREIPKIMSKKPSPTDTAQDKPGTRYSTRVAGVGSVVAPSSPNMTGEALQRRAAGNWNKPSGTQPKRDKVGNRQVRGRSIVTHDHETGITTVDPSGTKGGSKKIVTMPTSDYFNNPKYVRGKSLDLLNLALTMKFNMNKPITPEARRGLIQDTKVPGTENNQDKLQQEADFINTGTKIKPTGSGAKLSDEDKELGKALQVIKIEARKIEILEEIYKLKTDYNTDEVVREYTDEEDDKKKNDTSNNYYGEPPHGGNAGREPGETRDNESQSNLHPMNKPVKDDDADALKKDSLIKIEDDEDEDTKATILDEWKHEQHPDKNNGKKKNDSLIKTERRLHNSTGTSKFIHDRHFITTDGRITAHNPKSHEEQVQGLGHKDLSSFLKETGAARVTHNDKTNEFSVHSHHPYTPHQTRTIQNHIRDNKIDPSKVIHDNYHDKGPGETGDSHAHNSAQFPKGIHNNMSDDILSDAHKNDRAMTANNAEDGVNGKMRLDNDEPAETFQEENKSEIKEAQNDKDINTGDVETIEGTFIDREMNPGKDTSEKLEKNSMNIADPGHGSGGVRVGAAYDNAQQGTGQKDDPRVEEQEEYSGEEDRGPKQKTPKYSGERDIVTGSSNENYNKSILDLLKIQFDLKKRI
jgi:hypothetical protein